MPDYPLAPWLYGRAHGDLRAAGDTCSVRTAGQTLGTAQGAKAEDRKTTVKNEGTRLGKCAKPALWVSGCYLFHSCSRSFSLGRRPKTPIDSALSKPAIGTSV
jgi:hypothetical protein